jgi:aerobic C4-dicarboxylate transport protein
MTAIASADASAARPSKPWYRQLWAQVLIAMVVGILLGYFDPPLGERMAPLGDAFIKAIRMLIAPIIFCTVVHGIARMADMARVGRVAIKALIYFEVLTTIALIIGLVAANLWQPGAGMNVDLSRVDASAISAYVAQTQKQDTASFLIDIIPNTFIGAFSEGNILQVLFLSVLCGFALTWIGPRAQPLLDMIEIASAMLFGVVAMVMWAAPLGAFGAIAFTVGKFGAGSLLSLGKLLGGFY